MRLRLHIRKTVEMFGKPCWHIAACAVMTSLPATAATLTAIDDTILLQNNGGEKTSNFGGRNEFILGSDGDSTNRVRHGLLRFDVSSIAAEINADTDIESATLKLTERMARDSNNGTLSQTLNVFGVVSNNEGWIEGSSDGSLEIGAASYSYLNSSTQDWQSGGGTPNDSDLFTFGTDTGSSLGTGAVAFETGSQQTLIITITDLTGFKALLAEWHAADLSLPGTNAGLAIESAGNNQLFFESNETADGTGHTPAQLDITFVPEPSSLVLFGLGGLLLARGRRR